MKRKRLEDMGPTLSFVISIASSLLVFLIASFICSVAAGFFEDSRAGAEYLTLVCVLCSGFLSGFISRKVMRSPLPAAISMGAVVLIFAALSALIFNYSAGAFMNEITFLLLSLAGIFAAREKKRRRRR